MSQTKLQARSSGASPSCLQQRHSGRGPGVLGPALPWSLVLQLPWASVFLIYAVGIMTLFSFNITISLVYLKITQYMINNGYKRFSHSEASSPICRADSNHPFLAFVGLSVPTSLFTGIHLVGISLVRSMIFFPSYYCILEGFAWQYPGVSLHFSMVTCYSRVCKDYNLLMKICLLCSLMHPECQ